jgi:predicted metal-binding membrane protein
VRAGAHHGGYCLGCCWGLMLILVAVGVMNVAAMVGLAAVVLLEKTWRWGPALGRLAGIAALALALAVLWFPWLAPDNRLPSEGASLGCPGLPGDRAFPSP